MKKVLAKVVGVKNKIAEKAGASNIEVIIWISVCLIIATALFAFRRQIVSFIEGAADFVSDMTGSQGTYS